MSPGNLTAIQEAVTSLDPGRIPITAFEQVAGGLDIENGELSSGRRLENLDQLRDATEKEKLQED